MPLPESTVSVVDELKRRGFTPTAGERLPLYGARESLYKQSGLESALGSFTGTYGQNTKLLEWIRNNNINPQAVGQPPALTTVVPPVAETITPATSALNIASNQPNRMPTIDESGILSLAKRASTSLTEQDVMSQIPQQQLGTSAQDVLDTARGGLELSAAQREGAEALAAGETAATAKAEEFGSRGLYFSGARVSAEGAVRAEALSKKLSIDEGLARFIIQQQEQGDKETAQLILDKVKDIVSKDEDKRKEAITSLGAMGYIVTPDGQVLQKPSEARAEEAAISLTQQREFSQQMQTANYVLAQERLILAKQKAQILGQFLTGQVADQTYDDFVIDARKEFNDPKNIGTDTKVSPYVFIKWRDLVKKSMPAKLDDFDKEFVPRLSKQEQDRLGVYVPSTKNTKVQMQAALEEFLTQPGILE